MAGVKERGFARADKRYTCIYCVCVCACVRVRAYSYNMDAFFSSVLGKMSKTFGRFDDIDDDGTMKMTDDPATAMAQRPDELFERMKPPSSRRGVSGDDDYDDDESCIVHKNGPKSAPSSWITTTTTLSLIHI